MLFRLNVTSPLSLHKIFKAAPKNCAVFPAVGILTRHNRTSIGEGLQQRQSFRHQLSFRWVSHPQSSTEIVVVEIMAIRSLDSSGRFRRE